MGDLQDQKFGNLIIGKMQKYFRVICFKSSKYKIYSNMAQREIIYFDNY